MRYNSYARKQAISDQIADIRLDDFLDSDIDEGSALQKLARRIEVLIPQAPLGGNGDKEKRRAFHHGVRKYVWAQLVLKTFYYQPRKLYKEFMHELTSAEQNHRVAKELRSGSSRHSRSRFLVESRSSKRRSEKFSADRPGSSSRAAKIWYTGQARFGWDPKARKVTNVNSNADRRCYNCGDPSNVAGGCNKPRDEVRILKGRLKSLIGWKDSKAAIRVLKELLMEQADHVNFLSDELLARMMEGEESDGTGYVASSADSGDDSLQESSESEVRHAHYNSMVQIAEKSSVYSVPGALSADGSSDNEVFFSGSMNCCRTTEEGRKCIPG